VQEVREVGMQGRVGSQGRACSQAFRLADRRAVQIWLADRQVRAGRQTVTHSTAWRQPEQGRLAGSAEQAGKQVRQESRQAC
jgi:hypothetical protein